MNVMLHDTGELRLQMELMLLTSRYCDEKVTLYYLGGSEVVRGSLKVRDGGKQVSVKVTTRKALSATADFEDARRSHVNHTNLWDAAETVLRRKFIAI